MIRTPVLQAFPEQPPYMNPSTAFAHSPSSSPSCLPSASVSVVDRIYSIIKLDEIIKVGQFHVY